MITDQYAQAFRAWINAADPGYAPTALYGRTGAQAVRESAVIIVCLARREPTPGRRLLRRWLGPPAAPGLPVRETSPKARRTHAASVVQPGWD